MNGSLHRPAYQRSPGQPRDEVIRRRERIRSIVHGLQRVINLLARPRLGECVCVYMSVCVCVKQIKEGWSEKDR